MAIYLFCDVVGFVLTTGFSWVKCFFKSSKLVGCTCTYFRFLYGQPCIWKLDSIDNLLAGWSSQLKGGLVSITKHFSLFQVLSTYSKYLCLVHRLWFDSLTFFYFFSLGIWLDSSMFSITFFLKKKKKFRFNFPGWYPLKWPPQLYVKKHGDWSWKSYGFSVSIVYTCLKDVIFLRDKFWKVDFFFFAILSEDKFDAGTTRKKVFFFFSFY